MRKFIAVLLLAMLLVSVFAQSAEAVSRLKKGEVSYGTPIVDGVMDDCYKNSSELKIEYIASIANSAEEGGDNATGSIWLCWDEKYIYMFVDVTDRTPVTQPLEGFSSDAFESTFDFDNINDDHYGDNGLFVKVLAYARAVGSPDFEIDWVLGMDTDHQHWFADQPASEHQVACVIKSDGYIIERRVPLIDAVKARLKPGYTFGFQIWLLDDIDDNNQRDFKMSWGEPTDEVSVAAWNLSNCNDELVLIEAPPPPPPPPEPDPVPEAVPEAPAAQPEPAAPAPAPTPAAPPTGDGLAIVLAVMLAAGAFVISRRHHRVKF